MRLVIALTFIALAYAKTQPKIFGVGLSETGQSSLSSALHSMGFTTKQNDPSFIPHLSAHFKFDAQYQDVDAVLDIPTAAYYEDMLQVYPDARFILTERDVDTWFNDASQYFALLQHIYGGYLPAGLSALLEHVYGSATPQADLWRAAFLAHNQKVRAVIPAEQLLVLNLFDTTTNAYAALCAFLDSKTGVCQSEALFPVVDTLSMLNTAARASTAYATCHPQASAAGHAYVWTVANIAEGEGRDAYLAALVQIWAVLRTNTTADVVLLVNGAMPQVDQDFCEAMGIKVRRVNGVGEDTEVDLHGDESALRVAQQQRLRLRALQLVEYSSVIVFDTDFLVTHNMDAMFAQTAALTIQAGYIAPLYTGWFVIKPSCQDFNNINEIARSGTFNVESGWMEFGRFAHWRAHRQGEMADWSFAGASSLEGLLFYYYGLAHEDIQLLEADYDFENAYFTRFASVRKPWLIAQNEVSTLPQRLQAASTAWWNNLDELAALATEGNIAVVLETQFELKAIEQARIVQTSRAVSLDVEDPYGGGGGGSGGGKMMGGGGGSMGGGKMMGGGNTGGGKMMGGGGSMGGGGGSGKSTTGMAMPPAPVTVSTLIKSLPGPAQFAIGVAEAFISRILPDWVNCLRNINSLATGIESLFQDFHSGITNNLKQAVYDLAGILSGIQSIIKKCGLTEVAKQIVAFVTKVYSGFGAVVVGAKIVINGVNIFHNLDDALHAWKTGDWEACGKAVGSIIGYVV